MIIGNDEITRAMFLIPSLERGGAERQLVELVRRIDKTRFAATVVTFYDGGALRPAIESNSGITCISLKRNGRGDVLPFLWRLWRTARKARPHIMVGYLNLPSVLCLFVGRIVHAKVVWSLRASSVDYDWYGWSVRLSSYLSARLSRFADLIILNSNRGKDYHLANGYDDLHMLVIPNGIDTDRFRPMPEAGQRLRAQWGIGL